MGFDLVKLQPILDKGNSALCEDCAEAVKVVE
jgi:hypothetical protein